jgi:hypothetical protein
MLRLSLSRACGVIALAIAIVGCSSSSHGGAGGRGGDGGSGGDQGGEGGGGQGGQGGSGGSAGTGAGTGGSSGTGGSASPDAMSGGTGGADSPDAASGDDVGAPEDGGGSSGALGMPLETFQVLPGGTGTSKLSLEKDQIYLLRASGAIDFAGTKVDAEYASTDGTTGMDTAGGADVGLDNGLKELILLGAGAAPPKAGPNRMKWFGGFRADHVYYMWMTGAGAAVNLKLVAPAGSAAGSGSIAVAIYQLTPIPTAIGKPIESVPVSYLTKAAREMSMMKPAQGHVYLLRANGESQVGGAGSNGDADFDDYGPTSTNANQGEGGADFGICVDEGCTALRKLKWGPYRKDHDYYMLYAGTGMPITFAYCDTGFGDNKGSVPVDIYELP